MIKIADKLGFLEITFNWSVLLTFYLFYLQFLWGFTEPISTGIGILFSIREDPAVSNFVPLVVGTIIQAVIIGQEPGKFIFYNLM